jgi:hypothetical protein
MSLPDGWSSPDASDLAAVRAAAASGQTAALFYGGARFVLSAIAERDDNGMLTRISFELKETRDRVAPGHETTAHTTRRDAATMTGEPIRETLQILPVIPAASLTKLGPWETTAINQAVRRLLRAAAARVDSRLGYDGTGHGQA